MATLVLTQPEVRRLLPMRDCIDLMAEVFRALARGEPTNPLRWGVALPEGRGLLGMMPGYLPSPEALGIKALAVFPGNHGTAYDTHQGIVLLFQPEHGLPVAILDASEITAIRTAAASGAATRALARDDADDLAILGSGVQARTHLEAMMVARPLRRIRVYSPSRSNREAFAETESRRHGMRVEPAATARDAVLGAGLICTTTSSSEPVLAGDWIAPGAHINAVGACQPASRELDSSAVVRSRLFVDRLESALHEAGDYLFPKNEGLVGEDHIVGEIGDVLIGRTAGRRSPEEITLFKSLGLAVEDLAAADHVHRRALQAGLGTSVELGGRRHAAD